MVEHLPEALRLQERRALARVLAIPRRNALCSNLHLLHDALHDAGLAEKVWVTGGLLLGWARLGHPLPNDLLDADFGFMAADRSAVIAGFEMLMKAGFIPSTRWRSNEGTTTEWGFTRSEARFEFFEHRACGASLRVCGYFPATSNWEDWHDSSGEPIMQSILELPQQQLVEFSLVGLTWLKHEDHARELDAIYGQRWRAPDKEFYRASGWSTGRDSPAIVERTIWRGTEITWDGSISGP
jgi:hypothetical protein